MKCCPDANSPQRQKLNDSHDPLTFPLAPPVDQNVNLSPPPPKKNNVIPISVHCALCLVPKACDILVLEINLLALKWMFYMSQVKNNYKDSFRDTASDVYLN